jgi:fructose-specific phosphotransferase system component IIB
MKKQNIYLVAQYLAKPRDPRRTHIPGYMKDPANVRYDEQVQVSNRLRQQDLITAKIIINLSDKKVEQNSFNGNKDFNELFKYFFKGYHKYITEVMAKLDPEYFNQMLDEMQADLDKEKHSEEVPAE